MSKNAMYFPSSVSRALAPLGIAGGARDSQGLPSPLGLGRGGGAAFPLHILKQILIWTEKERKRGQKISTNGVFVTRPNRQTKTKSQKIDFYYWFSRLLHSLFRTCSLIALFTKIWVSFPISHSPRAISRMFAIHVCS